MGDTAGQFSLTYAANPPKVPTVMEYLSGLRQRVLNRNKAWGYFDTDPKRIALFHQVPA